MNFRIANTFTESLAKLTAAEQKSIKTTAFDLQLDPSSPGLSFHRLDGARDKGFFSVRASRDIRLIVHKTSANFLLCYVDHHDAAYRWAERRKLEQHPVTGAAQIVELRETVREIEIPRYVETQAPDDVLPDQSQPVFADTSIDVLLSCGVPPEWIDDVRVAGEDELLEIAEHLPDEAAEALLKAAVGETRELESGVLLADAYDSTDELQSVTSVRETDVEYTTDPFDHPDAKRRFYAVDDTADLAQALDYPWDRWTVFLHPTQKRIVEANYDGPFRVSGSAGTGKSIVALHRSVYLARNNPESRVLLTTFSNTLSNDLRAKLRRLIRKTPKLVDQLEVDAIDTVGERLYRAEFGSPQIATQEMIGRFVFEAADKAKLHGFSRGFLLDEWTNVIAAWQLRSWESYRDVRRHGRKTRLSVERRSMLWPIFEQVNSELSSRGLVTPAGLFNSLAARIKERRNRPYDFVVVDEAQDISVAQLRFLVAIAGQQTNGLFFAGDLGQRIFQTPFSWKALGVDVRGRSQVLKLNYRTSHQIRIVSDRLLETEIADVDGNVEDRKATVSTFSGEQPEINVYKTDHEEIKAVSRWLNQRLEEGVAVGQIGVFVRSGNQLNRARDAIGEAGLTGQVLDERSDTSDNDRVSISTMHLAKGLEFRAVVVMACDDEVIPLQKRLEGASDESDLKEVYDTERHLLYVGCTRARDHLLVTGVGPASEFLDDMKL